MEGEPMSFTEESSSAAERAQQRPGSDSEEGNGSGVVVEMKEEGEGDSKNGAGSSKNGSGKQASKASEERKMKELQYREKKFLGATARLIFKSKAFSAVKSYVDSLGDDQKEFLKELCYPALLKQSIRWCRSEQNVSNIRITSVNIDAENAVLVDSLLYDSMIEFIVNGDVRYIFSHPSIESDLCGENPDDAAKSAVLIRLLQTSFFSREKNFLNSDVHPDTAYKVISQWPVLKDCVPDEFKSPVAFKDLGTIDCRSFVRERNDEERHGVLLTILDESRMAEIELECLESIIKCYETLSGSVGQISLRYFQRLMEMLKERSSILDEEIIAMKEGKSKLLPDGKLTFTVKKPTNEGLTAAEKSEGKSTKTDLQSSGTSKAGMSDAERQKLKRWLETIVKSAEVQQSEQEKLSATPEEIDIWYAAIASALQL